VENEKGTAHDMKINGVTLAGKTGTAELKASKGDEGEILSWFNCFTADENYQNQLLIVSMVENARDKGGSHYLIKMIRELFE
jgi:penicillin-binding protein